MDIKGHTVRTVMIAQAAPIDSEYYLAFLLDRSNRTFLVMASVSGGMDIEEVAHTAPEKLAKIPVDANLGISAQKAKEIASGNSNATKDEPANTALIDGVKKFAMDVRELDIDLIDRINPFSEAYAILSKTMSEERLKEVAAIIAAKRVSLTIEDARELSRRALKFKQEHGRLPSITAADPWEKSMAEGVAFLARKKGEAANE
jgi:hypothetical protein